MKWMSLLLFVLLSMTAQSQALLSMSEEYPIIAVYQSAKLHVGSDAVLAGIEFVDYEVDGVRMSMSFVDATAQSWLYRYYSPSSNQTMTYRVLRRTSTTLSTIFPGDAGVTIPVTEWSDCTTAVDPYISAQEALGVVNSAGLAGWRSLHPNARIVLASLFDNSNSTSASVKGKYWRFDVADSLETYRCYVDATTRQPVSCGVVTKVGMLPAPEPFMLEVYPNPIRHPGVGVLSCHLILSGPSDVRLDLYDSLGKSVGRQAHPDLGGGNHFIPFRLSSSLSRGMYFLSAQSSGSQRTQVIVFN